MFKVSSSRDFVAGKSADVNAKTVNLSANSIRHFK